MLCPFGRAAGGGGRLECGTAVAGVHPWNLSLVQSGGRDYVVVPQGTLRHFPPGDTYLTFHEEIYEKTPVKHGAESGLWRYHASMQNEEGKSGGNLDF